jgi:hypothetical protein
MRSNLHKPSASGAGADLTGHTAPDTADRIEGDRRCFCDSSDQQKRSEADDSNSSPHMLNLLKYWMTSKYWMLSVLAFRAETSNREHGLCQPMDMWYSL